MERKNKYELLNDLTKFKKNKGSSIIKQGRAFVSNIQNIVNEMIQNNVKDITKIKTFLGDKNIDEKNKKIIYTIFNCRQNEDKILLNTNCFNKYIHLYLYGENIKTKCITNDYLYLAMISNALINRKGLNHVLYETAELENVSIISENFKLEKEGYSGFIQDYDPDFSIICIPNFEQNNALGLIRAKPLDHKFIVNGKEYEYFGNENACFITPINSTDDEIMQRYNIMKYMNNDNSLFKLGLKSIKNVDKLHFLSKIMNQEKFCPSFWASDTEIKLKFLFDYKLDYNTLFTYIQNEGINAIPDNFCYWTSIPQCFDFLSVLSITGTLLDDDARLKIADWCDTYNYYKPEIGEIKNNQLLLQRICNDFLNCFINNSEYIRFVNLYSKITKYCNQRDKINKWQFINNITNFLINLPFTKMISNQFKNETLYTLPNKLKSCIGNYLNGANPEGILNDIRDIAKRIQMLLPKDDMKDCAFPFIVAGGPLLGEGFIYNAERDPLLYLTRANFTRKKREIKKQQDTFIRVLEESEEIENNIGKLLTLYIRKFMSERRYRKNYDLEIFLYDIKKLMKKNKEMKDEIYKAVFKYRKNNKTVPSVGTLKEVDRYLSNYLEDEKIENIPKGKKKKQEEIPEDVDMDVEEEDAKSENIQANQKKRRGKYSLD